LIVGGYKGAIYPVNPSAGKILGLRCYPRVGDIPGEIDLALVTVPAERVVSVLQDCATKHVPLAAVITSGFGEVGNVELEQEVVKVCQEGGIRLVGPNIAGVISTEASCNASFCQSLPYKGHIAFITQSGSLGIALVGWTYMDRVGLSSMVSLGNMADVNFSDTLEYFAEHDGTNCITLYIEGVKDGRRFLDVCKRVTRERPVVALKAGVSERGHLATASHTGSLAGSAQAYNAAFTQGGVIPAKSLEDLFDFSLVLSLQPAPKGNKFIIITNGGGAGICAPDAAEWYGVQITDLRPELKEHLGAFMPSFGSPKNPVDLTGMATIERYEGAIKAVLTDDEVDGIAAIYCHTAITRPADIAEGIANAAIGSKKPVVACFIGGFECDDASRWLRRQGIPTYPTPEKAMKAIGALCDYGKIKQRVKVKPEHWEVDKDKVRKILEGVRAEGRSTLLEREAKSVLAAYGIPTTLGKVAHNPEEAVQIAEQIGYPVVLKISSIDILHKSDAQAVRVNVGSAIEVREGYEQVVRNAKQYCKDARIDGVLVQEMAPSTREVILGATPDPQFGPMVMFGLGGIWVETLKDITFRVAPITLKESMGAIEEIKGYPILKGIRGEAPVDIKGIAEALSRLSCLVSDFDEIVEVDANPVFVYGEGVKAVDALIKLV
jgi:acetyltransferase